MRPAVCLLLAAASLAAQPTIRVTTRLVDVNVIATDGKAPLTGLAQSDFTVLDNGVPREIAFFSVQSAHSTAPAIAPPPNVFTNRAEARPDAPGRLTVFVLDALNSDFAAQARVRQQLLKYLGEVGLRDRVAVWVMTERLRRIQDFTNDRKALTAAVEKVTPSTWLTPTMKNSAGPGASSEAAAMDRAAEQKTDELQQYWRMQVTNDLMKDLGTALAQIPGRKNVIWLSRAFPTTMTIGGGPDGTYVADRLNGTGRALAKGNVAVYPVDASGLSAAPGGASIPAFNASERDRHRALDLLAAATGGRAFYDTNDLTDAIRGAVADTEVTYTIGFYPGEEDGNYHRLQISVKRPGVTLRYRPGYLAPDASAPEERDEIRNALWSPIESAGIPLEVRLEKRDPKRPGWLPMTLAIASQNLGIFDLIVAQHAVDGHDLITVREAVRPEAKKTGPLILKRQVELRQGASTVRVVVFDHASGRAGSIEFPAPQ